MAKGKTKAAFGWTKATGEVAGVMLGVASGERVTEMETERRQGSHLC